MKFTIILKGTMSEGKLIIANTVLASLVEGWLSFFYSGYLLDYKEQDTKINKGDNPKEKNFNLITPNELSLKNGKIIHASNLAR